MLQRTLQRLTFNRHAKESPRCERSHTLTGEYCENPGTQRTIDGLLCEQHARQLGLEERIACWEAILLHIELLLQLERAEAAAALARAHEDQKRAESEGYERKEREIYGFMSRGMS